MRTNLLMNVLWYEDMTPEALLRKVCGDDEFTFGEIRQIVGLLGLTDEEVEDIFFS